MRITATAACLSSLLVCLCLAQGGYGTSQHGSTKGTKNQTEVEKEVHHRPKRGWIWNQFFVLEEHIGTDSQYVGKLHSNSDKGDGSVRYLLSGEGAGTIFLIDEVTGDIHATKSLDREKKAHYVMHAQAIDRHTNRALEPESEFIIKVQDVNDNAPKFPDGPFAAAVPEMSDVGTSVFQVTASDADDPTYGNSARVVYSILQGQPYFSVDPKTGVIRTALANMDREAREQYLVVVQAKDMAGQVGGLSGSTTVNVTLTDVNDNPPRFPQKTYQLYVPESAQVGKAVGKIKADDEDLSVNAEIRYSIANPEGTAVFSISTDKDKREGVISLRKPLDYEKKRAYTLHIEGANTHLDPHFSHLGPFKDTATLKIIVGDVDEPPVFSSHHYIMDVYENAGAGVEVGVVTARDPDSTDSAVRYFIDHSMNGDIYFKIDATTGVIKTTRPLDREEMTWYNITVRASEADNPNLISHVPVTVQVLDVNDNPPRITVDDEVIVCEGSRPGQVVYTVKAVDNDDFANGRFSFSPPSDIPTNPNFTIKDNEDGTGSIVALRGNFRRATQELYHLLAVVSDGGEPALSATGTLTVRVCACERRGRTPTCQAEAFLSSAGLSTGALVAILLCVLILLVIVVLFVTLRSKKGKKEPLIISEEDVRENVVTYDDEGGGEEDTEAFDIAALRNPAVAVDLKLRRDVTPEAVRGAPGSASASPPVDGADVCRVLQQRLAQANGDTSGPPYDSLQTYAYEGCGSPAGSVSPLDLDSVNSDQDHADLDDLGPEFHKLVEVLGVSEPDPSA